MGASIPLLSGFVNNFLNKSDKKNKRETRNAIKNSIETQEILPLISEIVSMLSKKVQFSFNLKIEEEIESIIYSKETWTQLDRKLWDLEKEISVLEKVDNLCTNLIKYHNWAGYALLWLIALDALGLIIYYLQSVILLSLWGIMVVETIIFFIIIRWKLHIGGRQFDDYEDEYIR